MISIHGFFLSVEVTVNTFVMSSYRLSRFFYSDFEALTATTVQFVFTLIKHQNWVH